MKVRYTRPAARQLAELVAALRAVNPFTVTKLAKSLARSLRRLSRFPRSGPRVPEFPGETIRQFFLAPHRFFYFIDDARQTVWIVNVWHGAQIPAAPQLPVRNADDR
jgi:plasmid stabilization system protein ParE